MNANFGLMAPLGFKHRKKERKELYAKRALALIEKMVEEGL
jgi:methylenetetrahydrofolate--tRNA-(uracil-5-)-methyltransferase